MTTLKFKPTVFRINTNTSVWDIITLDGNTPSETIYFMKEGDAPSSNESNQIQRAIENEDYEIIELNSNEFDSSKWNINLEIFTLAGDEYKEIYSSLKNKSKINKIPRSSIFYKIANDNNLDLFELDDIINKAFDILKDKYKQFDMTYYEDGVYINNFDSLTEEETGGWRKEEVENNLTNELIKEANKIAVG